MVVVFVIKANIELESGRREERKKKTLRDREREKKKKKGEREREREINGSRLNSRWAGVSIFLKKLYSKK